MNATATVERILDFDKRINAYAEIMKVIHEITLTITAGDFSMCAI